MHVLPHLCVISPTTPLTCSHSHGMFYFYNKMVELRGFFKCYLDQFMWNRTIYISQKICSEIFSGDPPYFCVNLPFFLSLAISLHVQSQRNSHSRKFSILLFLKTLDKLSTNKYLRYELQLLACSEKST